MELIVVSGPDEGKRLELTGSVRSIGRKPENDLSLTDPNVSGRHALIRSVPTGDVELTDLSSTNGIFVDGTRISAPVVIDEHASIQIGQNRLQLARGAAPTRAPSAPPTKGFAPPSTDWAQPSIQNAGPVAGGDIEMSGQQVAGRDLHYHEGFRIRSRMRQGARRLLYWGIAVICIGFIVCLAAIVTAQQLIFSDIDEPEMDFGLSAMRCGVVLR